MSLSETNFSPSQRKSSKTTCVSGHRPKPHKQNSHLLSGTVGQLAKTPPALVFVPILSPQPPHTRLCKFMQIQQALLLTLALKEFSYRWLTMQ